MCLPLPAYFMLAAAPRIVENGFSLPVILNSSRKVKKLATLFGLYPIAQLITVPLSLLLQEQTKRFVNFTMVSHCTFGKVKINRIFHTEDE